MTTIKAEDINFGAGTQVVSGAMKYVLPIPTDASTPLEYPEAVTDTNGKSHPKGEKITSYGFDTVGNVGVVVWNSDEKIYQGASPNVRSNDGQGNIGEPEPAAIIINGVTEEQAQLLDKKVSEFAGNAKDLTAAQFQEVEAYARSLGLTNMYDSQVSFVMGNMQDPHSSTSKTAENPYGFTKRDSRDKCSAVFVSGSGELEIASGSKLPFGPNGGVIVQIPRAKNLAVVEPARFAATYRNADDFGVLSIGDIAPHIDTRGQGGSVTSPETQRKLG